MLVVGRMELGPDATSHADWGSRDGMPLAPVADHQIAKASLLSFGSPATQLLAVLGRLAHGPTAATNVGKARYSDRCIVSADGMLIVP